MTFSKCDALNNFKPMKPDPIRTNLVTPKIETKSSAQVAGFVCQPSGSQTPGELKLDETRPYRIVIRFSQTEKELIGSHAKEARMPVSTFVRLTLLRHPKLDPERNSLLYKANYELTRQGANLNQIAKQMNAGTASIDEGNSMLAMIARSLFSAHQMLREALAAGRIMPDD